jgi:8-oxo-dGTP pyrophosphatase MutT (NUDIX family)
VNRFDLDRLVDEQVALDALRDAGHAEALARDTGRLLLPLRSAHVEQPGTWGTWGGAVDEGESPEEAARREVEEEAGYAGAYDLSPLYVFRRGTFSYHNFLAVVPHEFEPEINWETEDYAWAPLDALPRPLHFGLRALLADPASVAQIRAAAGRGGGLFAFNAATATYPTSRSPAFEATLPPDRRALLKRWLAGKHYGVRWVVFYEFVATAPLAEIEQEVLDREARLEVERAAAKRAAAEERREPRKYRRAVQLEVDPGERRRQRLAGQYVWLYHGTSSKLLPRIRREGLSPDRHDLSASPSDTTPGYVYLTANPWWGEGGTAQFYAQRAAGAHGGTPVVLRVRVPWDALEPDEDDAELRSGRDQYRLAAHVPPEDIAEVVRVR